MHALIGSSFDVAVCCGMKLVTTASLTKFPISRPRARVQRCPFIDIWAPMKTTA